MQTKLPNEANRRNFHFTFHRGRIVSQYRRVHASVSLADISIYCEYLWRNASERKRKVHAGGACSQSCRRGRGSGGGLKVEANRGRNIVWYSPSGSSRKVWRNTCTRCNEAGHLVCESNNNTSYLARTMCSGRRVCKLRRNVK